MDLVLAYRRRGEVGVGTEAGEGRDFFLGWRPWWVPQQNRVGVWGIGSG
jgi:hypothetical protein